jgi:hypothetical protein
LKKRGMRHLTRVNFVTVIRNLIPYLFSLSTSHLFSRVLFSPARYTSAISWVKKRTATHIHHARPVNMSMTQVFGRRTKRLTGGSLDNAFLKKVSELFSTDKTRSCQNRDLFLEIGIKTTEISASTHFCHKLT